MSTQRYGTQSDSILSRTFSGSELLRTIHLGTLLKFDMPVKMTCNGPHLIEVLLACAFLGAGQNLDAALPIRMPFEGLPASRSPRPQFLHGSQLCSSAFCILGTGEALDGRHRRVTRNTIGSGCSTAAEAATPCALCDPAHAFFVCESLCHVAALIGTGAF